MSYFTSTYSSLNYSTTLGILVLFELATGEELLEHTTGTVALVGTVLYVEALLAYGLT